MIIKFSFQEASLIKEALFHENRSDLLGIFKNKENGDFNITEEQLIDIDDCCQDYFCSVGLNAEQEPNEKGLLIERLVDKIYDYLEKNDQNNSRA